MSNSLEAQVSILTANVDELFLRTDASEARQSALEARQTRIERLIGDQQVQLQGQAKLLMSLNDKMSELVEAVRGLVPNGHG